MVSAHLVSISRPNRVGKAAGKTGSAVKGRGIGKVDSGGGTTSLPPSASDVLSPPAPPESHTPHFRCRDCSAWIHRSTSARPVADDEDDEDDEDDDDGGPSAAPLLPPALGRPSSHRDPVYYCDGCRARRGRMMGADIAARSGAPGGAARGGGSAGKAQRFRSVPVPRRRIRRRRHRRIRRLGGGIRF